MRLAWLTDIHLNFVDAGTIQRFFDSVARQADAIAISGDVAESHDVYHYLRRIEEIVTFETLPGIKGDRPTTTFFPTSPARPWAMSCRR